MANINGNITDDLFRQASEQYPLRTDSADWGRLSDDLEKDPSLILPSSNEEGGRRRRGFFWLFFLVPFVVAGYFVWPGGTHIRKASAEGQNTQSTIATPVHAPDAKTGSANGKTEPANGKTGSANGMGSQTEDGTIADAGANAKAHTGFEVVAGSQENSTASTAKMTPAITKNENAGIKMPIVTGKNTRMAGNASEGNNTIAASEGAGTAGTTQTTGTAGTTGMNPIDNDPRLSGIYVQRAVTSGGFSLNVDVRAHANGREISDVAGTKAPAAPVKKRSMSKHYFYFGLLAAPDFSTIKFQDIKSVGTTFGVLVGYSLNSKFSIESGVYLDRKKYYTEGQYFNKEKVPALWNYKLLSVDGTCNMVEIPVNLRYNLNSTAKNRWFATAGLSTYLMSSEGYNYQVLRYGNPYNVPPVSYNTPMHNWFSIMNLSMGYEQKLGKIGNLRLEPYLRVPLSGIGTGSLPIMSAGLNIGITRRFR
jgi:Outer membrane protein beta-barrel domain